MAAIRRKGRRRCYCVLSRADGVTSGFCYRSKKTALEVQRALVKKHPDDRISVVKKMTRRHCDL